MRSINEINNELEQMLKLQVSPFGMKLFESVEEMESIPRVRRPKNIHTMDQIVAQGARLNWTVGITADDLVGDQCRFVVGLGEENQKWHTGEHMKGVWYATIEDAGKHQKAMNTVPRGKYKALVVAPLRKWTGNEDDALGVPDIALFYASPGAMMYFINGLQWKNYEPFEWTVVGESSCADSWGRALSTGKPSLSIPCFAERRYGGVLDHEMLMAIKPFEIDHALNGMNALSKNGFRYPFPQYGIQMDVRAGMAVSY